VVSNAAWALMGAVEDVDLAAARAQFEVNLFGGIAAVQEALPAMRAEGTGVVVFTSSIGARITNPLLGLYHASKYALTSVAEALALEAGPLGVRVVLVEPGMVRTEFPAATTPTGAIASGEGPYLPLLEELRVGFGEWRRLHAVSAERVATAIVRAIEEPETPFRVLVGDDAALLAHLRARGDDARFHADLLDFLRIERHR
jgi:NAD(P)-dependent dehydrogenase (short-subunit alcohol dehydrogenase family)